MRALHVRVLLTIIVVGLVASACASDTGSVWTFAPVSLEADEATTSEGPTATELGASAPGEPAPAEAVDAATAAPEPAEVPAEPEPAPTAEPVEPLPAEPAPAEEGARVVELESTASLLFLQDGERIPDIAVTPGETVRFRIDNTAGFAHNFYIGEDSVLSVPLATTEVGIAAWESGVRELEWVVPDDIAGLMFGCTIPGHYFTQQGTFSVAP